VSDLTPLGPGQEFDALRDLVGRWGDAAQGIGDDGAVLAVPAGERIVVSNDACVENRHFREGWLTPEEVGYRAVTAALSDLAAMGARPIGVLWAVNVPQRWRAKLPAIADGVRDAVRAVGTHIIGGNPSASEELALTTTVIGAARTPLLRSGAKAGHKVYVTGLLGGPAQAVVAWNAGGSPDAAQRARFARPAARILEAQWIAAHGGSSAIDISDGLVGDLSHVTAASGVGARVELERVPVMAGVTPSAALHAGEEYELLVTAPALDEREFSARFGIPLTLIGECTADRSVVVLDRGRPVEPGRTHDHFG
jgi:thiamine-monophosphate kinase